MSGIDNFLNKNQDAGKFYLNNQPAQIQEAEKATVQTPSTPTANQTAVRDEFVKIKKNNGLIRKFYNFLKNSTGFGLGSKKVEKEIDRFDKGEISKEELDNKISQYKISQENGLQASGDLAAGAVSLSAFAFANNGLKQLRARMELNALPEWYTKGIKEIRPKYSEKIENIIKSKSKSTLILLPILGIIGGLTKLQITGFDRLGSKEFSVKKKDFPDKQERKVAKKQARKESSKSKFKEFATGAVSGLLAPITAIAGGIVGVPAYLIGTTGLRYLTNKNNDNKKSFDDFAKNLKDNGAVEALTAAAIAVPAFKNARYSHTLGVNLEKVVGKLKGQ